MSEDKERWAKRANWRRMRKRLTEHQRQTVSDMRRLADVGKESHEAEWAWANGKQWEGKLKIRWLDARIEQANREAVSANVTVSANGERGDSGD